MLIKISNKWLKKKFYCSEEMIRNTCKGRCCKTAKGTTLISILPEEEKSLKGKYPLCKFEGNKIKNKTEICFFKDDYGFCKLHKTKDKPLGCIFSPFKINKNNTLIIRHRYLMFPCFKHPQGDYAYNTFKASLIKAFGQEKYEEIKKKLETKEEDFYIELDNEMYDKLNFLEETKKDGL